MKGILYLLSIIFTFMVYNSFGQNYVSISDVDSSFEIAKKYAYSGSYDSSRQICDQILKEYPSYLDAKVLKGRIYAWTGKYYNARINFKQVLKENNKHYDCLDALIDLEFWDKKYPVSLNYCEEGLSHFPNDTHFLIKTIKNFVALNEFDTAVKIADKLYYKYPNRSNIWNIYKFILNADPNIVEGWLKEAKKYSFKKKYDTAQIISDKILDFYPNRYDVRIFNARTYSWQAKYDTARTQLYTVLSVDPCMYDCIDAFVDVELWSNNLDTALGFTGHGLQCYPGDTNFMIKRARILLLLGECEKSMRNCRQVIRKDKNNIQANDIYEFAKKDCWKEKIEVEYLFEYFKYPWHRRFHYFSVKYGKEYPGVLLMPRLNFGDLVRNNESVLMENVDFQVMLDIYPKLWTKSYGFFSYAYSPKHFLFPLHRIDAEIFQGIGDLAEFSFGFRYMQFVNIEPTGGAVDTTLKNVFIFTGSFSKYWEKWWVSVRPYVSPEWSMGTQSVFFELRRMYKEMDNYASLMVGFGVNPDEAIHEPGVYNYAKARRIRFGYKDLIGDRASIEAKLGFGYNQYKNDPEKFYTIDFNLILSYPF